MILLSVDEILDHYDGLCIRCDSILRGSKCVSCTAEDSNADITSTSLVVFNNEDGETEYFEEIWLQ